MRNPSRVLFKSSVSLASLSLGLLVCLTQRDGGQKSVEVNFVVTSRGSKGLLCYPYSWKKVSGWWSCMYS